MVYDRRRFDSVEECDMVIFFLLGYDLDRLVEIFKPLRLGHKVQPLLFLNTDTRAGPGHGFASVGAVVRLKKR